MGNSTQANEWLYGSEPCSIWTSWKRKIWFTKGTKRLDRRKEEKVRRREKEKTTWRTVLWTKIGEGQDGVSNERKTWEVDSVK